MAQPAAGLSAPTPPEEPATPTPRPATPADEKLSVDSSITLEAHDHQQLELQLAHALSSRPTQEVERFTVELFFFIPRNVGVATANYPRDEFYGDLTTYLRLDLPDLTLEEMASDASDASPFVHLRRHGEAIARGEHPTSSIVVDVKLFGHTYCEAVRDGTDALRETLRHLPDEPEGRRWAFLDEVDRFAESARAALGALRRAERSFEPLRRAAPAVLEVFRYTDEYSSLFLDGALALLAQSAAEQPSLFDGSGFVGRLRQTLARHARHEVEYRAARGYLNLVDGQAGAKEYFAYRQSFLKKAVQQALYVDTRRLVEDYFVRNATGAVAAGLAATWALVAQLPARIENLSPTMQTLLVGLPVIAYMAKDRIKELTRDWLASRVRAFDHKSDIRAGSLAEAGLGTVSGGAMERVRFLELADVPAEILARRIVHRTVSGADVDGERVLVYTRELELKHEERAPLQSGIGLRQIIRLNLRHFLTRLDEPQQEECHYFAREDRFLRVGLPKVYHINLIARATDNDGRPLLRRWRVVLNKAGIVRLEKVAAGGSP